MKRRPVGRPRFGYPRVTVQIPADDLHWIKTTQDSNLSRFLRGLITDARQKTKPWNNNGTRRKRNHAAPPK
jgi:hypothetical protein